MKTKNVGATRSAVLTVRVPVELKKRLEGLAESTARNRSQIALDAIQNYVEQEELQIARVDEGIRDAGAGRLISHARVKRYLRSWGRKRKLAPPEWK